MENTEKILKWIMKNNLKHDSKNWYVEKMLLHLRSDDLMKIMNGELTEKEHWAKQKYSERFTTKELLKIYNNDMGDSLKEKWNISKNINHGNKSMPQM